MRIQKKWECCQNGSMYEMNLRGEFWFIVVFKGEGLCLAVYVLIARIRINKEKERGVQMDSEVIL